MTRTAFTIALEPDDSARTPKKAEVKKAVVAARRSVDGVRAEIRALLDRHRELSPGLMLPPLMVPPVASQPKRATAKGPPRALKPTEKRIIAICRKKHHKGKTIATKVGLTYDRVRHILGRLVKENHLKNDDNGYWAVRKSRVLST